MPIKSAKQFRMMEGAASGGDYGPSKDVAKEMLGKTSHEAKSKFAKSGSKKKKLFGKK